MGLRDHTVERVASLAECVGHRDEIRGALIEDLSELLLGALGDARLRVAGLLLEGFARDVDLAVRDAPHADGVKVTRADVEGAPAAELIWSSGGLP